MAFPGASRRFRRGMLMIAVALLAVVPATAGAQTDSGTDLDDFVPELSRGSYHPRLGASLRSISDAVRSGSGPVPEAFGGFVDVELFPDTGDVDRVVGWLGRQGAVDVVVVGDLVSARVPTSVVPSIASQSTVDFARTASRPFAEAITGEGVAFQGADDWHAAGFDGTGVDVAVIDLGFAGYSALLGTELPASVETVNHCTAGFEASTAHGTGVAEIVHEVAPGATLHLICIDSLGDLSQAVDYAVAQEIDVINHSVGWFNTGRGDGTGALQTIVQDARDGGVLWINSGGNYADEHWSGTFVDADGDAYIEFSGTDETNTVTLASGQTLDVFMRWDDWPVSDLDYDLVLFDSALDVVAVSDNVQSGTQPPVEDLTYTNPGSAGDFHVAIFKYSGPDATPRIDVFTLHEKPEHLVSAGSLVDPASSSLVTAVGAVDVNDGVVEAFSSMGPTIDGRIKPDVSAPDRISGETYGPGGFAGTSAAAPNAAGMAALLVQRHPDHDPAQLADLLESVTTDAGDVGPDNSYGEGTLVDVALVGPPIVDAGSDGSVDEGSVFSATGSFTDPGGTAWTATVDYGAGAGAEPLALDAGSFSLEHAYDDDGSHQISVCVTDDDADEGCDEVQVDVANVDPQVDLGADDTATTGVEWTRSGSFADPGADSWTATVDWGEGDGPQPLSLSGTDFELAHTFTAEGTATVTVAVTDDDGGVGSDLIEVSVGAAEPGFLRVTTSPAVPSQIWIDGTPANTWGLDWLKLDPGTYQVAFSDVGGFSTPSTETVVVGGGATTTLAGGFSQRGWLRVTTDPAVPATISIDGVARNDWGVWTDLEPGDYEVCYGQVADYAPPSCETVTVSAGAQTDIVASYTEDPGAPGPTGFGMLRVTTSPAVASQILVDGAPADSWGLNWVKLAPGDYVVSFTDVNGFTTPADQTVTVTAGVTTEVTGAFAQRGDLRVTTSPAVPGTISVDGVPRNDWGMWTDLNPGSYEVCFGAVAGYDTPSCESVTVDAGESVTISGGYTAS